MRVPRNFDRWMFDYKEGNLNPAEVEYFEQNMLHNPEFSADIDAWDQAFIENHNLKFPNQNLLVKEKSIAPYIYSVAGLLLLLISSSLYLFMFNGGNRNEGELVMSGENQIVGSKFNQNQIYSLNQSSSNQINTNNATIQNVGLNNNNQNTSNYLNTNLNGVDDLNEVDENTTNNNEFYYSEDSKNYINKEIIDLEKEKIEPFTTNENIAMYNTNPVYKKAQVKETNKSNKNSYLGYGSLPYKIKQIYKKIERMSGYPVRVTNLRDPDILVPNNNLLSYNAGFTGGFGATRVESRYRNQWIDNGVQSSNYNLNFDTYSSSLIGGLGGMINVDDYDNGAIRDISVSMFYSPKFTLNSKVMFEPAIKLTMGIMNIERDKLVNHSMVEMERGRVFNISENMINSEANNLFYKDFGLGFVLNTEWFYAGLNVDNISNHKQSIFNSDNNQNVFAPRRITAIAGVDYLSNNKKMTLSPFLSYHQYGDLQELWGGVNFRYDWVTLGGAISSNKEFSASTGVKFKSFKLIYQYDYTYSLLMQENVGSHSVGMRFNTKRKSFRK